MALRGGRSAAIPLTFRPRGVCDAVDGSNAPSGAMLQLSNLVPSPSTESLFVCRPAAVQATAFPGFTLPKQGTALLMVGTRAYGMIASADFAGKDEPFCFDFATNAFVPITGQTSANLPTTQSTTGDWVPPTMQMVSTRIIVTHPGFAGAGSGFYFGWIDVSNFSSATITGDTHSNTVVDNLSSNVLLDGWEEGMTITSSVGDIPAGTTITDIAPGGLSITLSQAATGSNSGSTFTVTGGTQAAPVWSAGNTTGNPLVAVPAAVFPFNGRAWYAVLNSLVFSDSLDPTQVTNATQAVTLGDDTPVTALGGLPLNSTTQGGIIQSLIAFKGSAAVYQITGDQATTNLVVNIIQGSVGTLAPNTLVATPLGLSYIAPDGLRIIDLTARCSDPIGAHGDGVSVPFIYALNPSRMCAAFHHNILRIACQNGDSPTQAYQEFWFDFTAKVWTGPHTFCGSAASIVRGYDGPAGTSYAGHDFVSFATGVDGKLWSSAAIPLLNSVYTENGAALNSVWQTILLPDNEQMAENAIVESALGLVLPATVQVTVTVADEAGAVLDGGTVTLTGPGTGPTLWGAFSWGSAPWGALGGYFQQYQLNWGAPLVFKQASVQAAVASGANIAIGNLYLRYQVLGYLLMRSG